MEPRILTILLAIYLLVSFALALAYLFYRRCSAWEIALWGALAFFVPVLGPFLVIAGRPGPRKHSSRSEPVKRAIPSPKG